MLILHLLLILTIYIITKHFLWVQQVSTTHLLLMKRLVSSVKIIICMDLSLTRMSLTQQVWLHIFLIAIMLYINLRIWIIQQIHLITGTGVMLGLSKNWSLVCLNMMVQLIMSWIQMIIPRNLMVLLLMLLMLLMVVMLWLVFQKYIGRL